MRLDSESVTAAIVLAALALLIAAGLFSGRRVPVSSTLVESDASCSKCGRALTQVAEESSTDEWRAQQIEAGRLRIQQGLLVGEACLPAKAVDWQSSRATLVYYLAPSVTEEYAPEASFTANVLRNWLSRLQDLRVILILPSSASEAQREATQHYIGSGATVLLDDAGDSIRNALRLEAQAPSIGYLVSDDGIVHLRLPPVRPEMCTSIFGLTSTFVASGGLPAEPIHFPVPHPDQLAVAPWDLIPVLRSTEQSTVLVYFFAPGCVGCALTTEVAMELQREFEDHIKVVGLAYALSYDSVCSAIEYGQAYSAALDTNRLDWISGLSRAEATSYEEDTRLALDQYAQDNGIEFPVLVDWDRAIAGALGLGCAQMPSWALFDPEGALVGVIPGGRETVYVDGEPVVSAFPPFDYLARVIYSVVHSSAE